MTSNIVVNPGILQSLGTQFGRQAQELSQVTLRLQNEISGLNWDSHQKVDIEHQIQRATSLVRILNQQSEQMAAFLNRKVQAFVEADNSAASNFGGISPLQAILPSVVVPISGGEDKVNFSLFSLAVSAGGTITYLATHFSILPLWVQNQLAHFFPASTPGAAIQPSANVVVQAKKDIESAAPISSTQPQSISQNPAASSQWWADVPVQKQEGLMRGKEKTGYGCTPTSASMILEYWNQKDSKYKTASAQSLLNANLAQEKFKIDGMSATDLHDEMDALGYTAVDNSDATLTDMQEAVTKGPVLAIVRVGMATKGEGHAVVVSGISPDGKEVRVNDPYTGESHTYSWKDFDRSWGSNFGKGFATRSFVTILPKDL